MDLQPEWLESDTLVLPLSQGHSVSGEHGDKGTAGAGCKSCGAPPGSEIL